jgi:ribosomal protein L40E
VDGVGLFVLLLVFGSLAMFTGTSRARRELLRRQGESQLNAALHHTTQTDATGVLTCRRCGAEGSERAGVCRRCGAAL